MRCPVCPVPADSPGPCLGERHAPACGYVAAGRADWVAHLVAMASGSLMPPDPGRVDVRLAMLAELCPMGHGCSCRTRACSDPDRSDLATPAECRRCRSVAEWEAGMEAIG